MKKIVFLLLACGAAFSVWSEECGTLIDNMDNIGGLKKVLHCLDAKSSKKASPKLPRGLQKGVTKAKVTIKLSDSVIGFEVKSCDRERATVICTVYITMKTHDSDRFFINIPNTTFFDEFGNEHSASRVTMGRDSNEPDGAKDGRLHKYLPHGLPMKTLVQFSGVAGKITTVFAINVAFFDNKRIGEATATLRNIAIQGDE